MSEDLQCKGDHCCSCDMEERHHVSGGFGIAARPAYVGHSLSAGCVCASIVLHTRVLVGMALVLIVMGQCAFSSPHNETNSSACLARGSIFH